MCAELCSVFGFVLNSGGNKTTTKSKEYTTMRFMCSVLFVVIQQSVPEFATPKPGVGWLSKQSRDKNRTEATGYHRVTLLALGLFYSSRSITRTGGFLINNLTDSPKPL